ncbi:unnamed protein product, partial [Vitis vinifera]|uniref:Uncharacterized protein n=1 Tax=Vitis vinifera TaxID=29760 RepID=D7T411_VITVI
MKIQLLRKYNSSSNFFFFFFFLLTWIANYISTVTPYNICIRHSLQCPCRLVKL